MEIAFAFLIPIAILIFLLAFVLRKIVSRGAWNDLIGFLLHDAVIAVWHFVFGAPSVRIERRRQKFRNRS